MSRYDRTVPTGWRQGSTEALGSGAALALASTAVFVLALGLGGVAHAVARGAGAQSWVVRAAPALTTLLIAAPLVLLVHHRRLDALALGRPGQALVGAAVVLGAAALVFGADAAAGGTRVTAVDVPVLTAFLVTNTLLALALEALPEELTFRGGAFGALAQRLPAVVATAAVTTLFVLAPAASIALTWAVGSSLGLPVAPPTVAPGGQDPVAYGVLLSVFGLVLVLARLATGSVWACVGAHVAFLTLNRTLLPGSPFHTGVSVQSPPGAELLVLVYLVLAAVAFAVMIRRRRPFVLVPPPGRTGLAP